MKNAKPLIGSPDDRAALKTSLFDGKYFTLGELADNPRPAMPVTEALMTRRTVRAYQERTVPFEEFEKLINLTMHAPTACNEQLWKVIYIDDVRILKELYQRGSAAFIRNTKQAFLLLYNDQIDNVEYRDDIQSGAAFLTTFGLIAHSRGIGSCWVCHLPNKSEVKRIFGVSRNLQPIALMTFGYYRKRVKVIPRKQSTARVILKNTAQQVDAPTVKKKNIPVRKIIRWFYYKTPAIVRKKIRKKTIKYEKKFYFETYD